MVPDVDVEGGASELGVHEGSIRDHWREEIGELVLEVMRIQRNNHNEVEAVGGGDDVDERKHDVENEEDAKRAESNTHGMKGEKKGYGRRETSSSRTPGR